MKIAHKGLILISVPLIFEIIFVLILMSLLHQAEIEIKREAHSKETIATAMKLMGLLSEAVTVAGSYTLTNNPALADRYDAIVDTIQEKFSELDKLVQNNPKQVENLSKVKESTKELISLFAEYKSKVKEKQSLRSLIANPQYVLGLKTASKNLGMDAKRLIDTEKQVEQISPALQEKNRQLINLAFSAGIILNIVIAIALALFFSKGITKRLDVLTENSARIANHEPLNAPIKGSDEIAELDTAFHTMAHDLKKADRLKKQLIDMVSHDMKSPLTSVQGILTLLSEGVMGPLPDKAVSKLNIAQDDIVRLIGLINDLLDVEKMKAGKLQLNITSAKLSKIIESSLKAVHGLTETKQIKVVTNYNNEEIKADEERLIQVMINLLSNAIKFSPDKSTISINVKQTDAYTEINIIDQGRGIPIEQREKIFERFTQIEKDDAYILGGSGIGLYICKAIVESHNGSIGVADSDGAQSGSTFYIRIPKEIRA